MTDPTSQRMSVHDQAMERAVEVLIPALMGLLNASRSEIGPIAEDVAQAVVPLLEQQYGASQ